jgi:trimeric autotransporter adhesin
MSNDKAFKVKNGLELAGYDTSKAVTAVDVFVYDTSKDSDGGAWRKRTQGTSWYNETLNTATRGARREFPAVAVIVAEAAKVTIYDGDDPALPMWMVFTQNTNASALIREATITCVSALNGIISFGGNSGTAGIMSAHFIADFARKVRNAAQAGPTTTSLFGPLADRNASTYLVGSNASLEIVNTTINDVSMTVLPDAPIDPATGLPVPVIAVATAGGVSVIKDDGAVVDSGTTINVGKVNFNEDGDLLFTRLGWAASLSYSSSADYQAGDGFADQVSNTSGTGIPALQSNGFTGVEYFGSTAAIGGNGVVSGNTAVSGLQLQTLPPSDFTKGMSALLTSTYNTGWMNGDIKGAFLSDTDDTDLVGSGELVTNGTFDTDTSGWSNTSATIASVSGELQVSNQTGSPSATTQTVSGLVVGKVYAVTATYSQTGTGGTAARLSFFGILSENNSTSTPVTKTIYATATQTTATLSLQSFGTSSTISHFDNVSVQLADADRSVNNKGLIVNGTVTRTAVATGADLVAYSGFSASNYLEQPYNSALDFGTGDFCVMGWVRVTDGVLSRTVLSRRGSNNALQVIFDLSDDKLKLVISNNSFSSSDTVSSNALPISQWVYFCGVRSGSTLLFYQNGSLTGTTAITNATGSLSEADATLEVGHRQDNVIPFTNGSLALLRISATAPTAEQIAKIYNDEKFLFQENAQATLYGASDAVTALAHDDATNLLHVGTSAGRSVFQGLRRVENTTTAVGTAISAANNMIVEE